MALAGHSTAVHCASTDTTGEVDGIKSVEFSASGNLLDITDFADTTGAHSRILGLKDLQITVSGDYESADSPQALIRSSWAAGDTVYVRVLPNGSTGFKCACKVQDYSISSSVDGTVEFSATFMATGAIASV